MIQVKNSVQLNAMKEAGRITGETLLKARELVRPGLSTKELDDAIRAYIEKCGAKPSFLGYHGFPGSACISINDEVIHGIPSSSRILKNGDIVKIDVGATYKGFTGDSAVTLPVGEISAEAQKLIDVTRESFFKGIEAIEKTQNPRLGDVGFAIQSYAEANGFSVVREFVGHGVGRELHEEPNVPNFGTAGRGTRIYPGMTLAIEPMINQGARFVRTLRDGWTVVTEDGALSAHYEHSIAVTENGVILLTKVD